MPTVIANRIGNSGAEERFIELFCDVFGPEKGQYVYMQYPVVDIYGGHRTIDFAIKNEDGKIAIEIDGNQWHQPGIISETKYHDDLLKQNSLVHDGWQVYRWTSKQIFKTPDRIKDELITFIGSSPLFQFIEDTLPPQLGETFSLFNHQKEALESLERMRAEHKSIALLYHATGTGKTVTAVSDAKRMGRRTLFLAHTKELVYQAYDCFKEIWPEVTIGRYVEKYREANAYVVCGSIQSISANLTDFAPDDFGYMVIDECHHGTADTYRKIMSFFKPDFTLGLTATPERTDGEDLLEIFRNVAHKLDLKTAVELDTLVPVRCIRIKTNIDLHDVRINGFQYNTFDLETKIMLPGRNQLIVETYCSYVEGKPTVVFCTSVKHSDVVAELFRCQGIEAYSVSGSTPSAQRRKILNDYEKGRIPVLCACDLLNEGWDSPHTQVLFMARPTMSKTIYLQQLGRGMRKSPGKEYLMVFDFVDNANMFNTPYSMHRLLGLSEYHPGGLVLGNKKAMKWDKDLFAQGEKPDVLIDYPIHAFDMELIDLFNWQEKAKDMISQIEFTRRVSVQSETIDRYIRDGKILPDMEVPVSEHRSFKYFYPETVKKYAKKFNWELITPANMKDMFMKMVMTMTMSYSYKPVFILSFLDHMDESGMARLEDVVSDFTEFYEDRIEHNLPAEKKPCIFTKGGYTYKDEERLVLSMPFKRFEDMNFIHHAKHLGTIKLEKAIVNKLTHADVAAIRKCCREALYRYFDD